jgi:ubiquitin-like 1-activating enzyme E1 A
MPNSFPSTYFVSEFSGLASSASHEFSPVCAVIGGMLGQDMLKALSAREAPIANFFTFDGTTCLGTVCKMNMQ